MGSVFLLVFVDNKLSVGYMNGASYVQKFLEQLASKKSAWASSHRSQVDLKFTFTPMH